MKLWRDGSPANKAINPYSDLFPHVHPLVIGAVDRSSSLSVKLCTEILGFHLSDKTAAEKISVHLNSAYPAHDYPIVLQEAQRVGLNVKEIDPKLNQMLLDLHGLYSEMGQSAVTDSDERNYHNNEITNIVEAKNAQVFFQVDKDWHYRKEERRWSPMNDKSAWRKVSLEGGRRQSKVLHIH